MPFDWLSPPRPGASEAPSPTKPRPLLARPREPRVQELPERLRGGPYRGAGEPRDERGACVHCLTARGGGGKKKIRETVAGEDGGAGAEFAILVTRRVGQLFRSWRQTQPSLFWPMPATGSRSWTLTLLSWSWTKVGVGAGEASARGRGATLRRRQERPEGRMRRYAGREALRPPREQARRRLLGYWIGLAHLYQGPVPARTLLTTWGHSLPIFQTVKEIIFTSDDFSKTFTGDEVFIKRALRFRGAFYRDLFCVTAHLPRFVLCD